MCLYPFQLSNLLNNQNNILYYELLFLSAIDPPILLLICILYVPF